MPSGGKRNGAGRRRGTTGVLTEQRRAEGAVVLPDEREQSKWDEFLENKDVRIRWEAFKLAKQYKSGLPTATQRHEGHITLINKRDPETPSVVTPDKPAL